MIGKTLGVIVARGGSKRLPGKNIRPLGGRPLIAWTIEAGLGARSLGRLIVSTDDPAIAGAARAHGAEVPFLRPARLATDEAGVLEVLRHALEACDPDRQLYDTVVLLQATSPFRAAAHIDAAVELFRAEPAGTVTAVCPSSEHPWHQFTMQGSRLKPFFDDAAYATPRHQLPGAFIENGSIYVIAAHDIAAGVFYGGTVRGYAMDRRASTDIDTPEDFLWAEFLLSRPANPLS